MYDREFVAEVATSNHIQSALSISRRRALEAYFAAVQTQLHSFCISSTSVWNSQARLGSCNVA